MSKPLGKVFFSFLIWGTEPGIDGMYTVGNKDVEVHNGIRCPFYLLCNFGLSEDLRARRKLIYSSIWFPHFKNEIAMLRGMELREMTHIWKALGSLD